MILSTYTSVGDAFYVRFQEFGTVKMAVKPFFFPEWRIWQRRVSLCIAGA